MYYALGAAVMAFNIYLMYRVWKLQLPKGEREPMPVHPRTQRPKAQIFGKRTKFVPKVNDELAAWRKEHGLDLPHKKQDE